jgi:oxygen-independent coproporphyrinogen-3 oxidase
MDTFAPLLLTEASLRARETGGGQSDTLYFGGGTPALLGADRLARLLDGIARFFPPAPGAEITVEANPAAGCDFVALRRAGFTRLSLGVQALQDHHLVRLGRPHTGTEALDAVRGGVASGLSVSADLIYGFEGLARGELVQSAEALLALGVEHLSVYSLEEPRSREARSRMAVAGLRPASPEDEERQWNAIRDALRDSGLLMYEVSNFCRPGRGSRHNLAYWTGSPYIGLGPGAHGFRPGAGPFGERYSNVPDLDAWSEALGRGSLPPGTRERLTREEGLLERLFLSLRMADPFSAASLAERFDADVAALARDLADLATCGDLESLPGNRFRPTPHGMRRADGLALWLAGRSSPALDAPCVRD